MRVPTVSTVSSPSVWHLVRLYCLDLFPTARSGPGTTQKPPKRDRNCFQRMQTQRNRAQQGPRAISRPPTCSRMIYRLSYRQQAQVAPNLKFSLRGLWPGVHVFEGHNVTIYLSYPDDGTCFIASKGILIERNGRCMAPGAARGECDFPPSIGRLRQERPRRSRWRLGRGLDLLRKYTIDGGRDGWCAEVSRRSRMRLPVTLLERSSLARSLAHSKPVFTRCVQGTSKTEDIPNRET